MSVLAQELIGAVRPLTRCRHPAYNVLVRLNARLEQNLTFFFDGHTPDDRMLRRYACVLTSFDDAVYSI